MPGLVEADFLPGLAGVGGAVDAVAGVRHDPPNRVFARADVDHVRVALGAGDSADGAGPEEAVGDVAPADAHVLGLPQAAARGAHVVSLVIACAAGSGDGAYAGE